MGAELKYFFTFGQNHIHPETLDPMKDFWVEVIVHEDYTKLTSMEISLLREKARDVMFKRYGQKWSMMYEEKDFNGHYFPKGCYQQLYYPLPEDLKIIDESKFAVGDMVKQKQGDRYTSLYPYFNGEVKQVTGVVDSDSDYVGYQFVFVIINGKEQGFYASALEKVI